MSKQINATNASKKIIKFSKKILIFLFMSKVPMVKVKAEKLTDLQGNLFFVLLGVYCYVRYFFGLFAHAAAKKTMKAYSLYSITKDQELLFYSHCNNQHNQASGHGLTILLLFCFMVLPCKASYIIIVIYLPGQLEQGPK